MLASNSTFYDPLASFSMDGPLLENWLTAADLGLEGAKPRQYSSLVPDRLMIDPEILNLYAQINPKILNFGQELNSFLLGSNTNSNVPIPTDAFLFGPVNLTLPELPGLPPELFLHLIAMFFTYHHPTLPVIEETRFFENLIPMNNHHPMLLNAIYAIGCHYSRHPMLYQSPFYSPNKAAEFFINRAYAAVPAPDSRHFVSTESIGICQAACLLVSCDFSIRNCRTWMMVGMACRLSQKYELHLNESRSDFFSSFNAIKKTLVGCPIVERKRALWGCLLVDTFVGLSTGLPMILAESDLVDTLVDTSTLIQTDVSGLTSVSNESLRIPDRNNGSSSSSFSNNDADRWKPYLSGFPKDTVFGATELFSERWGQQSLGFFQVHHLFSNMDDAHFIVQLAYLFRKVLRHTLKPRPQAPKSSHSASISILINLDKPDDEIALVESLHAALIQWYECLPQRFRLFTSLESLAVHGANEFKGLSVPQGTKLPVSAVMINLMFFAALATLHHRHLMEAKVGGGVDGLAIKTFKMSTSSNPVQIRPDRIVLTAYRGQCRLLRFIYGPGQTPTSTSTPISELASSGIISTLLMPPVFALLGHPSYTGFLVGMSNSQDDKVLQDLDAVHSMILPTLTNLAQVWPIAEQYARTLKATIEKALGNIRQSQDAQMTGWMQFNQPFGRTPSSSLNSSFSEPFSQGLNMNMRGMNSMMTDLMPSPFMSTPIQSNSYLGSPSPQMPQLNPMPQLSQMSQMPQLNPMPQLFAMPSSSMNSNQPNVDPVVSMLMKGVNNTQTTNPNWHSVRSEFEEEFLL